MKKITLLFLAVMLLGGVFSNKAFAQDDDCCAEDDKYGREDELLPMEWEQQMFDLNEKKVALLGLLDASNKDLDKLKSQSADLDKQLIDAENALYSSVGMTKNSISDFRKKFEETEKKINNKLGTCEDAKKLYFNEIDASKAKCLPEFYSRYLAMKTKMDSWCKELGKTGQYTVIKGDCLWKIAGKKEIYSNNNYWPKLWEANEHGVISAPDRTPKKVVNPNLIYPGQVLKVPALNDEDLKKLKDISYLAKNQKAAKEFKKEQKKQKKSKTLKGDIKKDKVNKTDDKKDVKKEKDVKKDTKKDVKK
ncbi:MAG: LysM peptidoglycan-binding domain-containing protein [Ignavibacteriae bacterium]|nr:LysM peptidoglycan-binding domain-containing protein [Ignavibacteriota bacterium]